jgi:DNA polymerase-3 subunit alpha
MTPKEDIEKWLIANRLNFEFETDHLFVIKEVGRFVIIQGNDGVIIDNNFHLVVSQQDVANMTSDKIDFFAFKFGTRWYYSANDENIELTELRYLGVELDIDETFPLLGVHGGYDLCNGSRSYKDWCKKAKFCKVEVLGIAEENTLAGTLEFQNACGKAGIKSIIGETITVKGNQGLYLVKLYVQNITGWKNLLNINAFINVHNEERFIEDIDLFKYSEGLVCVLTPEVKLDQSWAMYDMAFLESLYYQIDISQWSSSQKDQEWLSALQHYIKEYRKKLKPILIQDAYYLEKDHAAIRKELNAIGKLSFKNQSSDQYFKTPTELLMQLISLFDIDKDGEKVSDFVYTAIDNLSVVAASDFKIESGKLHLPDYKMTDEQQDQFASNDELLWSLIEQGFADKIDVQYDQDIYVDRIEKEMKVIREAKLQDYFLITWDILNWCRANGIMTGYGRGSAAGCLVAYLLGIVQVDPLQYDLLFERFLNEGRLYKKKKVDGWQITDDDGVTFETDSDNLANNADGMGLQVIPKEIEIKVTGSMPDIDNDIAGDRRDEVKRYIEQRYGANRVAGIGTYGALKIKSALGALGRRAGVNQGTMAYITGAIEDDDLSYDEFFKYAMKTKPVKKFVQDNPELIEKLPLILDQPNTASMHAAGIIIVPESTNGIFDQLPVKKVDGMLISEWEMEGIEQAGFLKMDILGLKQLDKFTEILQLIKELKGKEIKLTDIPLDHPKVYRYFAKGYNEDVFQFGGLGLKGFTKDLKPEGIEDLIATVALYRPGPIEMKAHTDYVKRKNGGKISYPFGTKEILKNTYGLLVYQEQVQKIAEHVAGFTPNEADDIRKAIGKKLPELMAEYKDRFVKGCVKNGCPQKEAEQMWSDIEGFGAYSFNKSHATCYAITGYYCQWLKVNYPLEFWLVSLKHSSSDQIVNRLAEMSLTGDKEVGGPNINRSTDSFTSDGNKIYWNLQSVKQVGEKALADLLRIRAEGGEYFSVSEFATRAKGTAVKRNTIINLIFAGAFDELYHMKGVSDRYCILTEYVDAFSTNKDDNVLLEYVSKWEDYQWILKQRDVCGLGMINVEALLKKVDCEEGVKRSGAGQLIKCNYYPIAEVLSRTEEEFKGKGPIVGGVITKIEEKTSKKREGSDPFAIIEISDGIATLSGVMWSEDYSAHKEELKVNNLLFMKDVWIKYDDRYRKANTFMVTQETQVATLTQ